MSVTTRYTTRIVVPQPQLRAFQGNIKGTPCMEIMDLAIRKILEERGGVATKGYRDCSGKHHDCVLGIQTRDFAKGIGVDVDGDGKVAFRYDEQGADVQLARAICDDLARAYATIAVMRAQSRGGYRVSIESHAPESTGRAVTTVAVRS